MTQQGRALMSHHSSLRWCCMTQQGRTLILLLCTYNVASAAILGCPCSPNASNARRNQAHMPADHLATAVLPLLLLLLLDNYPGQHAGH
jgi:hypothetical protein